VSLLERMAERDLVPCRGCGALVRRDDQRAGYHVPSLHKVRQPAWLANAKAKELVR
jgi:hypothetical protein